jgi:DNA-binding response OmpR family regulator
VEFRVPRILILDDEPLISMLVEGWLTELGCEVVGPARSVQEGLDFAGNAVIDGAILDVNLGGQNSYSVANALTLRGIPFAFATGDSGVDASSGFANPILLAKPFDFEGVKTVLGKLLRPAA